MSNYNTLKTTINLNIKQNGNQEITGPVLNSVLNQMVNTLGTGYQFAGVATTATLPGTPDAKVFYLANGKGIYTNFGGLEVTEDGVVVLYWDNAWHKVATEIASNGGGGQDNPFKGLNVVVFGDDITALGGSDNTISTGWTKHFLTKANPKKCLNYAHSGATWSHTAETTNNTNVTTESIAADNVIYNQIAKFLLDVAEQSSLAPDLIIIMAGTNDANASYRPSATSKSAADEFADSNGYITGAELGTLTSIVSAMRYDIETLRTNFPVAQIVVMTPIESTTITLAKIKEVSKCIYECAEYLGIDCVRLGDHCGIYREMEVTAPTFLSDGTHPNENGAKMIGYYAASAIKSIVRSPVLVYVPDIPDIPDTPDTPTPSGEYEVFNSLKTIRPWPANDTTKSISLGKIVQNPYKVVNVKITTENDNTEFVGINNSDAWGIWTASSYPCINFSGKVGDGTFSLKPLSEQSGITRLIVTKDEESGGVMWSAKCEPYAQYTGIEENTMGQSDQEICVFPATDSTSTVDKYRGTFNYLRLYSGNTVDTMIYDFVPALRKSDGMKGILDRVNNTFHFSESNQDYIELK